jgi:hypothetical protein
MDNEQLFSQEFISSTNLSKSLLYPLSTDIIAVTGKGNKEQKIFLTLDAKN